MNNAAKRLYARDFAAMLALSDARKTENAKARVRARADVDLCAVLLADVSRRGQNEIDWPEYFRNVGI